MGADQQYEKVPESEDQDYLIGSQNANVASPPLSRAFWKKPSFLITLAVGTIIIALLTAVAARSSSLPKTTSHVDSIDNSTVVEPIKPTTDDHDDASLDLHDPTPAVDDSLTADHNATLTDPPILEILDCGQNPVQARAKGCVYDVMMQLWTPAPCYDAALSERFLAEGTWTWWADPGATRVYSDEVIALGEHEVVYVSPDYHKTHCIFSWEKLVRALRNQKPIIEQLISYDHTIHCRHKALAALDGHGAIAPTGFTRCAMYETWKQALPPNKFSTVDK